ncbi:flagellar biosynthetic protein FliO [Siminovitchia sp. 179-K 8D1 HS]|uniref:flagellar biosynthetic protein FliO n=1 Tax=Siminovitchia sp. 179-K 8D1 HS TaxID=3142385 RepID=UPI00399F97E4
MIDKSKFLWTVLIFFILINPPFVQAGKTDYSVGECLENPDKCKEDTGQADVAPKENQSFSIGVADVFKMLFALIFVIALLYYLLKFINKRSQSYQQTSLIQNLGGTALGGNRSLQMVRVGKRLFVLGVGEDIRLIKEISDEKEIEEYFHQYNEQLEKSFQPTKLTKWFNSLRESARQGNGMESNKDFQQQLMEEMDGIKKERTKALDSLRKGNDTHE